ncbi:MAG TPA: sigma-54 dependent transcriptional regulator [Rectinemataceae bacterium]|nr:sigma-54 dependent transcriptional regulator [Rectinemataceae bacterium]
MSELPYPESPVVILDEDRSAVEQMIRVLARAGIDNVIAHDDLVAASQFVQRGEAGLALLDLSLADPSGEKLLDVFVRSSPQTPVIVLTAGADGETAAACMRSGALDYLVKPIEAGRLLASVWNGLSIVELKREVEAFRDRVLGGSLSRPEIFRNIVTCDPHMLAIFKYIESVGKSRQPVLITGETGTGKELFARAVHEASGRSGPFVAVNVGGLDDSIFSDSLFGHLRGAYTGADTARAGFIRQASGGTIFLDEVGDLEPRSQIKLLRLLQEGEYYPLGSDRPVRSEARVVAATTKDLNAASRAGTYRNDLYYRLQTHPISLPPLRERRGDISLLVDHFLRRSASALRLPDPALPAGLMKALAGYDYPGNVRELESFIHDVVTSAAGGSLDIEALIRRLASAGSGTMPAPEAGTAPPRAAPSRMDAAGGGGESPESPIVIVGSRFPSLREVELALFRMALERTAGNVSSAASMLGISRQTLAKRLKDRD